MGKQEPRQGTSLKTLRVSRNLYGLYSCACTLSHVRFFETSWTVACQAPLSMGFSRREDWIGLPCPPPGDLPDPGFELGSLPLSPPGKPNSINMTPQISVRY